MALVAYDRNSGVAVLFAPAAVQIIDIFRALGDFEDHYDVAALDAIENDLACLIDRHTARAIVSSALLFGFGLRRERGRAIDYAQLKSRHGRLDEYRILALMGAAYDRDAVLAAEIATSLGAAHAEPLVGLARDIAVRLGEAGLVLDGLDPRVLRAQTPEDWREEASVRAARKKRFDF